MNRNFYDADESLKVYFDSLDNQITLGELFNRLELFCNTYKNNARYFNYKGYECKIRFNDFCFCGYVNFDETVDKTKIYTPHGDFTDSQGFDCHHSSDFSLVNLFADKNRINTHIFRSEKFVENEIKKIVDSIEELKK